MHKTELLVDKMFFFGNILAPAQSVYIKGAANIPSSSFLIKALNVDVIKSKMYSSVETNIDCRPVGW